MTSPPAAEHQPRSEYICALLSRQIIETGVAPAAAACVAVWRSQRWWSYSGTAGTLIPSALTRAALEPVLEETAFDLASVTKSVVAVAAARAVDLGLLSFTARLDEVLPWTRGTGAGRMPLELLLAHRAGLEAHRYLSNDLSISAAGHDAARELLIEAANSLRIEAGAPIPPGGFPALYSDLGYMLIGAALEHATGIPLDDWISETLAAAGLTGLSSARQLATGNVAATEWVPERGGLVQGVVHDENAWSLAAAGCAGHAGLFGNAFAVTHFGCRLLDWFFERETFLSAATLNTLLRVRAGDSLRAGFDGKSDGQSSIGDELGSHTFGHLGFTGTSYWCDPGLGVVVCLLTNRVCPTRANTLIRAARPQLHDALARFVLDAEIGPNPTR